jgi:beta-phosphoglucomutase
MELGAGVPRDVLIRRVMGDDIDGALFERMMARKVMHVEDVIRESGLVPIDGAEAFIRAVRDRGLKTAVATASRTPGLLLEGAGLGGLFEVVVDRNQVERAKPDPDIFLRASSLLGVDASDCIVIEDSPLGVEAGLRAGMRVIAMTTSEPRARLERAHAVVDGFGSIDLEQWLPGAKG